MNCANRPMSNMRYELCDPQLVPLASPDGRALALFETASEAWSYLGYRPGRVYDVVLGVEVLRSPPVSDDSLERDEPDRLVS